MELNPQEFDKELAAMQAEPVTDEHDADEGPPADAADEFPEEADEQ